MWFPQQIFLVLAAAYSVAAHPGQPLAPRQFPNETFVSTGMPGIVPHHSIRPPPSISSDASTTATTDCRRDPSCLVTSPASMTSTSAGASSTISASRNSSSICRGSSVISQFNTFCLSFCPGHRFTATVFQDTNITETLTRTITITGSVFIPQATITGKPTVFTPIAPCTAFPLQSTTMISNAFSEFTPTSTVLLTSKLVITSVSQVVIPQFSSPTVGIKTEVLPTPPVGPQSQVSGEQPTQPVIPSTPAANPPVQTPIQPTHGRPNPGVQTSATITVGTVPVVIGPTGVVINSKTFGTGPEQTPTVVVGDQTFTVNPSQVVGGGVTLVRPAPPAPASPTPTTVGGVPILVGPSSVAVIGGTTFSIGPSSPQTTVVVDGQTVSVGPGGIAVGTLTLVPSELFTTPAPVAVPTVEVIQGQTVTLGPIDNGNPNVPQFQTLTAGHMAITEVYVSSSTYAIFGGQTFVIGSMGPSPLSAGVTIPANPSATVVMTAAGLTFSEIGSTLAVVDGSTYTIGAGASPTAALISGQTVSFGPGGIGFSSTTIAAAASSVTASAQLVTLGDLTVSEYGSTVAVIGGNTYRIGPGAWAVTEIVNGETISIGPSGVAIVMASSSSTSTSTIASATTTKKSAASREWGERHIGVLWMMCLGLGVWSWF